MIMMVWWARAEIAAALCWHCFTLFEFINIQIMWQSYNLNINITPEGSHDLVILTILLSLNYTSFVMKYTYYSFGWYTYYNIHIQFIYKWSIISVYTLISVMIWMKYMICELCELNRFCEKHNFWDIISTLTTYA